MSKRIKLNDSEIIEFFTNSGSEDSDSDFEVDYNIRRKQSVVRTYARPQPPTDVSSSFTGSSSIDIDVPGPSNATVHVNDDVNNVILVPPVDEIVQSIEELEARGDGDEVGLDDSDVEADVDQSSSSDDEEVMPDYPEGPQNLYEWRVCNKNFKFHPTLFEFDETNSGINPNVLLQDN